MVDVDLGAIAARGGMVLVADAEALAVHAEAGQAVVTGARAVPVANGRLS